ncbi:hypothetical protein LTR64_007195 [Lithohypha guttulata]|uniref:uncharacterized protein n=1 Tax=Lithohypha guttulata TaxID=1690604 RepID=UPI00315C6722
MADDASVQLLDIQRIYICTHSRHIRTKMRLSGVLTLTCCIAALILSFLCLFAGSRRSVLQNGDLLTLNTSRLGYLGESFNTSDGDGGLLDSLLNNAQGELNDLINDATTDIASALNISDYYSVHLMNYCEGMYEPNGTVAAENGTEVDKNTTYCSPRNALFHFNVTDIVASVLPDEIDLSDLNWPDAITDAQNTIRTASIATVVLYIIGIVFTGLALFGALFSIFTDGRLSACLNILLDFIAFLALTTGSVLATVVIVKAVNAFNNYGEDIGISATKGKVFLGMTWAAAGLMFVATVVSIVQLVIGRKSSGGYISHTREKGFSK